MTNWPLVVHLIIGALMAVILTPRYALLALIGAIFIWFFEGPSLQAGLVVIFFIGFFAGIFDLVGSQ